MKTLLGFSSLLVVLGLAAGCRESSAAQPTVPDHEGEVWLGAGQLQQIHVAVAKKQEIVDTLLLGGKVAFDDLSVSHVFSPVTGKVTKVLAQPGQRVEVGTPLAIIVSPDVGSSFSDLMKAQADLQAAEHEQKRQKELFTAHAGAERDYENAQDNYAKARAEYQRAEQKARMLRSGSTNAVTQEYTLRAPIAGEVVSRSVNPGVEVQGQYSGGNAVELFTVGELDVVNVMADAHEAELAQIETGQTVMIDVVTYPGRKFQGEVQWISSTLDPVLHTAKVRCRVKNKERLLKPEMYATVTVPVKEPAAVALPKSAFVRLGNQTVVFVARGTTGTGESRFERRPVQVNSDVSGNLYPVLHGLDEGETVVVDGAILLTQES